MAGDLLAEVETVALAEQEQPRSEHRPLGLSRVANEDDVEFQPVDPGAIEEIALLVEDGATDRVRAASEFGLVAGGELLVLAAGVARLPEPEAENRVLTGVMRRQGEVGTN